VKLVVEEQFDFGKDSGHPAVQPITDLKPEASIQEELDAMMKALKGMVTEQPDVIIASCMGLMARCTEIKVNLIRLEPQRWAKYLRISQLQPIMELIEFTYKGASRLVEIARLDVELSK
jgi:hypothetical protein